jgi:hypothetical protein
MTKRRLASIHVVLGLMAFVCTAAAAPPRKAGKHCVVRLEQGGAEVSRLSAPSSAPSSTSKEPECYSTFQDAVFFGTGGSVLLPGDEPFSQQLDFLGEEMKAKKDGPNPSATSYVLAIDYEHSNYSGNSLIYTAAGPCTFSTWYYVGTIPLAFKDKVSSTLGFSDCGRNIIFVHENSQGASITCTPDCPGLGSMNDTSSSREFRHVCQGQCGNGQCQAACGEPASCSIDCPPCGNGLCQSGENSSNCCQDCGAYCGNGICQTSCGESALNCPVDCGCGDGTCGSGESSATCCQDCASCGDSICQTCESPSSCPVDCPGCGDGICDNEGGECMDTCPQDCPDYFCLDPL